LPVIASERVLGPICPEFQSAVLTANSDRGFEREIGKRLDWFAKLRRERGGG